MHSCVRLIGVVAIILFLAQVSSSQPIKVEEISDYKIYINITSDSDVEVKNEITLRNLIDKPLVPGIGEIRLQKSHPMKVGFISVPFTEVKEKVKVKDVRGYSGKTNINVRVEDEGDYTSIFYEIWQPIEPKGEYKFIIEYSADLIERGIFFKTLKMPVGSDVDIRNLEIFVNSDWRLTYSEPEMDNSWHASIPANHIAFFTAEFSVLPLPELPIRGYMVFWGAVIIALTVIAVVLWRRR